MADEFDFVKLGEVPTVDEVLDTDTVLVVRDSTVYRADKSKVGGSYLLELAEGDYTYSDNQIIVPGEVPDMIAAYQAGSPVTVKFPAGFIGDGGEAPVYLALCGGAVMAVDGVDVMAAAATFWGEDYSLVFYNGADVSEASLTSLTGGGADDA